MTCNACGDTPKKKDNSFTKAVVEINNPETLILFRKVVIPASMGDEETVPPVVGKYKNVLLYYEANGKSYLYSSDGIPTQLANGITNYEDAANLPQINGITLVGNKSADDLGLALSSQAIKELSSTDYDYPDNNPTGVALWRLSDGIYHNPHLVRVYSDAGDSGFVASSYWIKVSGGNATQIYGFDGGVGTIRMYWVNPTTGECTNINEVFLKGSDCVDYLTATATNRPLSAKQGKVLKDMIDGLITSKTSAPTTSTVGTLGQLYTDTTNMHTYQCTAISGNTYTWTQRW